MNQFLYYITNHFVLKEFKKYTNFPTLMEASLEEKYGMVDRDKLDCCIKLNFEKNIPKRDMWMGGAFKSLKLTEEFYRSACAERIFFSIYGITRCVVHLAKLKIKLPRIVDDMADTISKVR